MCTWILDVFYGIRDEDTNTSDGETNDTEVTPPHDYERCEAGRKGTCRKCKTIRHSSLINFY
jgi:hypothetical protein